MGFWGVESAGVGPRPGSERRRLALRTALTVTVTVVLLLTGCSGEDEPAAGEPHSGHTTSAESPRTDGATAEEPTPSGSAEADAIEIEIEGDRVQPNGRRVQVSAGEPVVLAVTSDRAAELHVHSSPEQMLEVEKGESTVRLTVETPGLVDVEEHESGTVLLQLEVR
jgi:hypothetical protein